jgi:L-lactate dehydrogenase
VELAAQWISEIYEHRLLVVGTGTSLDSLRLKCLLAERLSITPQEVDTIVLGEHGEGMTPIFSLTRVTPGAMEKAAFQSSELPGLTARLRGMATEIRQTEPGTRFGPAYSALGIMQAFEGGRVGVFAWSVRINQHYRDLLGIDDDIFLSLPCRMNELKLEIVDDLKFSYEEIAGLRMAAANIIAQR